MMPSVSLETTTLLVKIAFLVGAVTDGLAIIPMLSRRAGVAIFGGDASKDSAAYRYAMGVGAALMAGWTVLLFRGAANTIERRDILLLTVFPVITGIAVATAVAARNRVVLRSRMVPLWIHLGAVSIFYIVAYALSVPFARGHLSVHHVA
jgi:undecaprenyl pyrophosphate phosphatase UppP